jgi:Putative Actinobacterial Holin-X, holin superfamily III
MPTHGADNGHGVAGATKKLADHAVALGKLELKLALLELKEKAAAFELGAGLLVGAAVFAVFALGFLLAASAAALAIVLATWLALLVVAFGVLVAAGVLGALGLSAVKRGASPVPEQAIAEAKLTTEAVKTNGHR